MMTVQQLIEVEEIRQLKYRYIRAVDTHRWDLIETCFAEDAEIWFGNGRYKRQGRKDIVNFYVEMMKPSFVSSHMVVHPEIAFTGEVTATGTWRVEDIVHFTEANLAVKGFEITGGEVLQGAAQYYDEYVKINGAWQIKSCGYVRIFEQIEHTRGKANFRLDLDPGRGERT